MCEWWAVDWGVSGLLRLRDHSWNEPVLNPQSIIVSGWLTVLGNPGAGGLVVNLLLFSRRVVSDSLRPHRLQPTRLLSPWDSPGKNTEVGCHFLLQRIFWTQGQNLHFVSPALAGRFFTAEPTGSSAVSLPPPDLESLRIQTCKEREIRRREISPECLLRFWMGVVVR